MKHRLEEIKSLKKYQIPLKLEVSKKLIERMEQRKSRLGLYVLITIIVTITAGTFCYFFLPLLVGRYFEEFDLLFINFIIQMIVILFATILGGGLAIGWIIEAHKLGKRISNIDDKLIFESDRVLLMRDYETLSINFDKDFCLDYISFWKYYQRKFALNWKVDFDAIGFKQIFDKNAVFEFGPIEDFPDVLEFMFCYLLERKKSLGLLLPEDVMKTLSSDITQIEKEKPDVLPKVEFKSDVEEEKLSTISLSEENLQEFAPYLEPEEKVFINYKPLVSYKKNIIFILVGIVPMIIFTFLILNPLFSTSEYFGIIFGMMIASLFVSMSCCFSAMQLPSTRIFKHSRFIFTNKKIIAKYRDKFCLLPYKNINSIIQRDVGLLKKSHQIDLNLKQPMEASPFTMKRILYIPNVPLNLNLIEQIKILKFKDEQNE